MSQPRHVLRGPTETNSYMKYCLVKEDVLKLFSRFGTVTEVITLPESQMCFVTMSKVIEAFHAYKVLNKTILGGKLTLKVDFFNPSEINDLPKVAKNNQSTLIKRKDE